MNVLFSLILLISCGKSWDYGELESDDITISDTEISSPTWQGSISLVILHKCANCHTENRGQFVPLNTPKTLDDINLESFVDSNKSLLLKRVQDTSSPMPPLFSTPLSDREKSALIKYLGS